jgi:hypothetical protein
LALLYNRLPTNKQSLQIETILESMRQSSIN